MRSPRFASLLFGTLASGLLLLGAAPSSTAAKTAEAQSFEKAVEAFYREDFRAHPIAATQVGVHDYDAEVDDLSQAGQAAEGARLHESLDAFTAIDPAQLSQSDRDDRDVLINEIKARLLDVETIRDWQKNPGLYSQSATMAIFALVHRDFAPLSERLRSVIARERRIPAMLASGKANVEHPPLAFVELAIRNISGSINFLKLGVPAAFATVQDDQLKREFAAANDAAIASFESFKTYLEQELKPTADGQFALGPELFAQRAAYSEMVDIPPERLLEIAYAQLRKDRSALWEAAREIDSSKPVEAVLKEVRAQHPAADALIPAASDDLAGLRAFVQDHHIATIPSDLLPQVEDTPEFRRATTAAALDAPGALETRATQAFYYVTPPDKGLSAEKLEQYLEAYFFAGLKMISSHEVWPGHFMQYLTRRSHPEWSLARKMAHAYSTTEGWAHYAEQMMIEQGLGGGDPRLRAAQLQMALMRDCRFVSAIELHTKGKSVDEAAEIFMKECGSPEPEARREAYRGARDPGYMNYTLGKLQILKLREDYRAKMGDQFSLTEFHDRLLGAGLPPIKIIRREMLGEDGPTL
jgi:uncharacterized protein (DUF885 family)